MDADGFIWDTPFNFYFQGYIFLPVLVRLVLLVGPSYVGLKLHRKHVGWLWRTLLSLPHGRAIAINLLLGMTVPLVLGLSVRLFVEPFGQGWDFYHHLPAAFFGAFLAVHLLWDIRRIWRARKVVKIAMAQDVERVRGYVEKIQGLSEKLHRLVEPQPQAEMGRGRMALSTGLKWGSRLFPTPAVARKLARLPHQASQRWMLVNLGQGLFFHLSPLVVLYLLFGIH